MTLPLKHDDRLPTGRLHDTTAVSDPIPLINEDKNRWAKRPFPEDVRFSFKIVLCIKQPTSNPASIELPNDKASVYNSDD